MCGDNLISFLLNKKRYMVLSISLLMVTMPLFSCGTTGAKFSHVTVEHRDGVMNLYILALRFAPRLYLHPDEPYEIIGIIPVFHPVKPIIAYHIFFEEEVLFAGRGKEIDHEILWVGYDPITLKASDVATLWHRTVLRTHACIMNAKASQQRPSVCIQWGQHGVLPLGWETLMTVRPRVELLLHYNLVKDFSRLPWVQDVDTLVIFQGSREEYCQFTKEVDAAYYVINQEIIVAEYPHDELRSRIEPKYGSFGRKKEWPWWSPQH